MTPHKTACKVVAKFLTRVLALNNYDPPMIVVHSLNRMRASAWLPVTRDTILSIILYLTQHDVPEWHFNKAVGIVSLFKIVSRSALSLRVLYVDSDYQIVVNLVWLIVGTVVTLQAQDNKGVLSWAVYWMSIHSSLLCLFGLLYLKCLFK